MACKCASFDGEGRYRCSVSGDGCMYFIPDSKRCAEEYGEGPDADNVFNTEEIRYKTIYADPPWNESGGGKIKRGADRHYPLMKTKDIMALPVSQLAGDNCHLYIWTTNNFLPDALKVIEAWGFRYVTTITWLKDRIGLGQYYRGITEHCLFAVKGNLPYKVDEGKRQQGITGFTESKTTHSTKPETMRKMIEKVSYGPRIELFARDYFEGWDCWGNEV